MEKTESRRSRMTRRIFRECLKELLVEKDFGRISVSEICERADMNRSTFYAHYTDQFDLMWDVEDEFLDGLSDAILQKDAKDFMERYTDCLRFIYENGKLFLLLTAQNSSGRLRERIIDTVCALLRSMGTVMKDDPFFTQKISYVSGGSILLMEQWIKSDDPVSVEDMGNLLLRFYYGIEQAV